MHVLQRISTRTRVTLVVVATCVVCLLGSGVALSALYEGELEARGLSELRDRATNAARIVERVEGWGGSLDDLPLGPDVACAALFGGDRRLASQRVLEGEAGVPEVLEDLVLDPDAIEVLVPLEPGGGWLYLRLDPATVRTRLAAAHSWAWIVFLASVICAWCIASRLCSAIVSPLVRLTKGIRRVQGEGDLSLRVEHVGDDETGALIDGFNDLLSELQRRERAIERNASLLVAHDAAGDLGVALGSLRCAEPTGPLGLLERRRADRDLAFSLRWTDSAALLGSADIAPDGGIESEIELPDAALTGAAKLLLPGEAPPGRAQLASRDSLVHVRVRPSGGLDLTSLVPAGGQADRMFQLRSALFSGVRLEGSWEVALYVPADGQRMPRGALALGVTQRAAAVAAMDAFVDALREAWPMRRSEFSLGDAAGACLPDLNLAPDLAPCYLATGDQLVIGWNAASLRHALAAPAEEAFGSLGGAYIAFDRFAPADRALAAAWTRVDAPSGEGDVEGGEAAPPAGALQYPWRRLVAEGWRRDDIVHIRLLLEAEDT